MSEFKRHVFSGSRFIFWGVVPLALLLTILLNFSTSGPWTPLKVASITAFDVAVALLCLGLYDSARFRWALRTLTAIIFTAYLGFAISSFHQGKKVLQALAGFLIIGVPSLIYAVKGRFSLREQWDDFPVRLANSNDTAVLREPLDAVLNEAGVPDFVVSTVALTAAEVVAAMQGGPVDLLPTEIQSWPARHAHLCTPELIDVAQRAVERVATQSELQQAWEAEDSVLFRKKIQALHDSLRKP